MSFCLGHIAQVVPGYRRFASAFKRCFEGGQGAKAPERREPIGERYRRIRAHRNAHRVAAQDTRAIEATVTRAYLNDIEL